MMRLIQVTLFLAVMLASAPKAAADVSVGATVTNDGLKTFHLAIGDFFKVPEKEVVYVRERSIPDEEMPVVFFLARHAETSPKFIVDLRLARLSWMDITRKLGLTAEIYYVAVKKDPGPPYGKAYGYYKNTPRKKWNAIDLADVDIVNLVNLRFISQQYGYSPDMVIKQRCEGKNFIVINHDVKVGKEKHKRGRGPQTASSDDDDTKGSKGNGKKKDK
jgi:hypothetical protein